MICQWISLPILPLSLLCLTKSYTREGFASLTPDQIQKFGGGEKESSVILIQNVMKYIADMKMSVYVTHATSFTAVSSTIDPHAVRGRFNNFTSLLNEVRFNFTRCLS